MCSSSDAAILPRIVPIGDVDEDELAFAEAAIGDTAGATLDLPEPLSGLERKVLLAQLILKWAASPEMRGDGNFSLVANSPAAALLLAGDLARLMDDMVDAAGAVGSARRPGADRHGRILAKDAAVSQDRARALAGRC